MKVITFLLSFLFSFILIGNTPTAADESQSFDQVNSEITEEEIVDELDNTSSPAYSEDSEVLENFEENLTVSEEELIDSEVEVVEVDVENREASNLPENSTDASEAKLEEVQIHRQSITLMSANTNNSKSIKNGDSGPEVLELKKNLAKLGFVVSNNPNEDYGPKTAATVKQFQRAYGLQVNGIADEATLNKINELLNGPLKQGMSSPRVVELKQNLAKLGFVVSKNPNEDYGPKTTRVVKEFQGYYGLAATGEADEATLKKIDQVLSSPYQIGNRSSEIRELKLNLAKVGFKVSNNPNDYFGASTRSIVIDFQRAHGLRVNGIADEVTLAKINELLNGPLKQGVSNPRVVELKKDLAKLGFVVSKNPNEDYGPKTTRVVKEFQRYYGLTVTGEADEATLKKIDQVLSSPYQIGNRSPEIRELKLNLAKVGFAVSNNPNDYFGVSTRSLVRDFQRAHGLRVNGIADERTLAKVNELLATIEGPFKPGMSGPGVKKFKQDMAQFGFVVSKNPNEDYGPKTTAVVKEFQSYYGLPVTGEGDELTLAKIEEMLSSPYHVGKSSPAVKELKLNLAKLDFKVSNNPNNDYGSKTSKVVREFQSYYGLKVNGIADEVTLKKIDAILSTPYSKGQSNPEVRVLKENLAKLGFVVSNNPNNDYGPKTERVVKEFQEYYGLRTNGIADEVTLKKINDILSSPYSIGQSSSSVQELKLKLAKLGFEVSDSPDYDSVTANVVKEFQRIHGLRVNGIADEVTLRKIDEELNRKVFTVFIDPGHGGSDPGAVASGKREKDINLAVSKKVRNLLENRGYKVIMSRTDDSTVDLYERPRMANELDVDIFVSIHSNSSTNTDVYGIETYYYIYKSQYPPRINKDKHNDPVRIENSRKLAELVHSNLISYTGSKDRKVGRGAFVVTRETKMPSILIELGFISNLSERNNLTSNSYQDKLAKAIADGIVEYFKQK